jgi:hypothetical protein
MLPSADCFGIRPEKFFQRLRISSGDHTDRIGSLDAFFTSPEVLPKMCQMIERVKIDPLLHRIGPLLVRDCHVSSRPSDGSLESFGHLSHCWSFADQSVRALKRRTRIGKQGCGYTGYVLRADEWNDGRILAPRQEDGAFFGDAPTDKSAHVFVIGWRLEMNDAHLRPVEDAISQPMLQIPEAGSMF